MKLYYALVFFSALQLSSINAEKINPRHRGLKREPGTPTSMPVLNNNPPPSSSSTSNPSTSTPSNSLSSPSGPPQTTTTSSPSGSSTLPNVTTISGTPVTLHTTTGPPPLDTGTAIPPLANITLGMSTQSPLPVSSTYAPGATPPNSGAPALPTPSPLNTWPPMDKIPDTTSPEVQIWMKELDGWDIPDLEPTTDGTCASSPAMAADAANRGWWTCGGYTRVTDITACPDKLTWGVSFDDGPSRYTQKLLNYVGPLNLKMTLFVVGSRVIQYIAILIEAYMSGHEIMIHTWSHPHLTTLTNAQIVAELGWTRKAIKSILGITPLYMRPPYGDIDDRVRAICLAMGMIPVIWTSTRDGGKFDTNDWMVPGGTISGNQSVAAFQQILNNATLIDTGFIVLQHDLYELTVDLAVGYTLPKAQGNIPQLNLLPIGECNNVAPNIYLETNTNTSFPYPKKSSSSGGTTGGIDVNGDGSVIGSGGANSSAGYTLTIPTLSSLLFTFAAGALGSSSIIL